MIYFLIVVTVGGTSGIMGPFVASLLLGVADVAGKYYLSSALGGFVIYVVLIVVLVLRPHGLFARAAMSAGERPEALAGTGSAALAMRRDRLLAGRVRGAAAARRAST